MELAVLQHADPLEVCLPDDRLLSLVVLQEKCF